MTTLAAGLHIADRYRLDRRIAVGGMGEVWEASDTRLDRAVAVKVLRPELSGDEEFLHRFRIEARTVASLDHSGIALVHDYGEDDAALGERRTAYLVMELVRGEPLSNRISRGRMDSDETLRILEHAAWALDAAHQRGFVHRDVKPGNILLRDDGVVKLTDFGIAKAANAVPVTRSGMVMGTAHYIAPEQASGGEAGPAGDVYSLGIVGYECLAGKRPFRAENPVVVAMMQVRDEPPPLPDDVPDEVRRLIETVLVKDPAQRYRDGAELARAVAAVRRGEPVPRPSGVADDLDPDGSPAAGPRQAGRRPSTVAGTAGSGGPRSGAASAGPGSGAASAGPGPEVGGPESEGTAEPQRRRSRRARRMAEERGSDEDRRAALTAAEGRVAAAAGRWARARTRSAHRADGSSDDAPAAPGPYLADVRTDTGDGTDASRAATGRDSAAGQGDDVRHRAADGAGEAPGRHTAPAHAAAAQAPPETSVRPPVSDPLAGTPYPEPRSGPLAAPVSGSVSGSLSDSLPRSFVGPPPESPMSGSPYVEPSYLDPSPYAESASSSSSYVESPPYPGTSASVEASSYVESPPPGSHTTRPGTGAAPGSPGHGAPGHDTPGRGSQPQDVPRSPARGSGPAHAAAAPSAAPAGAAHATQTGAGTTHPRTPTPGAPHATGSHPVPPTTGSLPRHAGTPPPGTPPGAANPGTLPPTTPPPGSAPGSSAPGSSAPTSSAPTSSAPTSSGAGSSPPRRGTTAQRTDGPDRVADVETTVETTVRRELREQPAADRDLSSGGAHRARHEPDEDPAREPVALAPSARSRGTLLVVLFVVLAVVALVVTLLLLVPKLTGTSRAMSAPSGFDPGSVSRQEDGAAGWTVHRAGRTGEQGTEDVR
ncbi:hypothetical protein PSD17_11420 [Pseudonocardia sp. D17]|nr:hypothetical protein PSD17_11420 [Pseudonocardia sp. D17]